MSSIPASLQPRASRYAVGRGIELQVREQGSGDSILLLHGFPDHAGTWRALADQLAPEFRLIMPDLRGYGLSSRPVAVADYSIDLLVGDLVGLVDALGLERVFLCGHDWGGVLAFELARRAPGRIAALVVLNAPPREVLQDLIWHDPDQRAASQYISVLRSSAADATFCEGNVDALIDHFLGEPVRRGELSEGDLDDYRRAWTQPGAWQAMLAWYRAAPFEVPPIDALADFLPRADMPQVAPHIPTLVIWGDRDAVFVPAMPDAIAASWPDCRVERISTAGHVPHREAPGRCAELIAAFLPRHSRHPDGGI